LATVELEEQGRGKGRRLARLDDVYSELPAGSMARRISISAGISKTVAQALAIGFEQ